VSTAVGFLPPLSNYDRYRTLGEIRGHTIVVSRGADILTPPAHSRDLAAGIPGAVHVHLPNAAHAAAGASYVIPTWRELVFMSAMNLPRSRHARRRWRRPAVCQVSAMRGKAMLFP
jgi:pimeloyl-ACP methyl ester carboxylesterase